MPPQRVPTCGGVQGHDGEHMLKSLNSGIDTLEVGYKIDFNKCDGRAVAKFWNLVQRAQELAKTRPSLLCDFKFLDFDEPCAVSSSGLKPYTYVIKNNYFHVRLSKSPQDKSKPPVWIKLTAFGLACYGHEGLIKIVHDALSRYMVLTDETISRVDMFIDFQGYEFAEPDDKLFRSTSKWRVVMPNLENPETWQFGKNDVVVRLYNKSKQIMACDKQWTIETWPDLIPELDVWRWECQLRRTRLKEFGINTFQDLNRNHVSLALYGLGWTTHKASLRTSGHEKEKLSDVWLWLTNQYYFSGPSNVLSRLKNFKPDVARASSSILGYMVSSAVALGKTEFDEVWDFMYFNTMVDLLDETSFSERVAKRKLEFLG